MIRLLLALALLLGAWVAPETGRAAPAMTELRLAQADVRSLESVLAAIARRFPGRALDARLTRTDRGAIYRIKWLGQDGRVRDITVDAGTGQILQVR